LKKKQQQQQQQQQQQKWVKIKYPLLGLFILILDKFNLVLKANELQLKRQKLT